LCGTGSGGVTYTVNAAYATAFQGYNAFTDLTRFDGDWYLVFRQADGHNIPPPGDPGGVIRVLTSADGQNWSTATVLSGSGDLRDPKISITPQNQLMIIAGDFMQTGAQPCQSAAWFSADGSNWSAENPVGQPDSWLWRTVWHNGVGYGISYGGTSLTDSDSQVTTSLSVTTNGLDYVTTVPQLNPLGEKADESGMTFLPNGTAVVLTRCDWDKTSSIEISTAASNYTNWTVSNANLQVQSPDLLTLPDGRIVAAGRLYTSGTPNVSYTGLSWLDPKTGTLTQFLAFPDTYTYDDTGYPGMYWYNNQLWLSYYGESYPQGYSDIDLAQVSIPPASWTAAVSGSWSTASNWGGASPSAPGALVVINAPTSTRLTVTLDGPQTVGTLLLGNSASASVGYALIGSGSNMLTLDNSGSGAAIVVTDGTHIINAPVVLADNLVVTGSGTLEFGGSSTITETGGSRSLTMDGAGGTLILSGSDNYTGGTIVSAGTLVLNSIGAIADGTNLTVGNVLAFDSAAAAGSSDVLSLSGSSVPEPGTLGHFLAGVLAAVVGRRRVRSAGSRLAQRASLALISRSDQP
jgi:autotransporter-associated beta strand protein